jgi:hypothetical protein
MTLYCTITTCTWGLGNSYIWNRVSSNPNCFKTITKLTASGGKEPLVSHPLHSTGGGAGDGCAYSATLQICFIKAWITLTLSSKAHWKLCFYRKPLKHKNSLRDFASHFFILKIIFCFSNLKKKILLVY